MKVTFGRVGAICVATLLVGAIAQATGVAQSGQGQMGQDRMGKRTRDVSYTGCVEAGPTPRTYVLTHVAASDDAMGKDAMANDSMTKPAMAPATLSIVSQAVDLSAHVGHKVTVSGTAAGAMNAMKHDSMSRDAISKDAMSKDAMAKDSMSAGGHAFTVKTLTTIASSCH